MALVFPDPNNTSEFEAPNGITYRWDATDEKWVVGSFSDSDSVQCIGNTGKTDIDAVKYGRSGDPWEPKMVQGDQTGPGNPATISQFIFNSAIDTSALKVGGRFNLNANNTEDNFYRVIKIEKPISGRTRVAVAALDTSSSQFQYLQPLRFQILDLPAVEGDCLKCDPDEDETICEAIGAIRNDIIELEEEIDTIAPSVERGVWQMTLSGGALGSGEITMYDGTFGNGSPIGIFKQAESVWFSANDTAGVPHGFGDVEPGYLLELFVQGEDDYGLFEVVEVHDQTPGSPNPYYAIDVNFIRALSNTSKADPGDLVRMKTFQAPNGGNAGDFVLKEGDDMTGRLSMDQVADLEDFTAPSLRADPSIRFLATKSDDSTSTNVYLYQPGYKMGLVCSSAFWSSTLITKTYLYGYEDVTESDGRITRDFKNAGLGFLRPDANNINNDFGSLAWKSTNPRLTWDANRVEIPRPVGAGVTAVGFQIKGATADNYTSTVLSNNSDLLQVRHRDSESDHIQYFGRITDNNDIVTKEYVDEKFAESGRVLFTPLEFMMDFYSQYPTDNGITGLTSGGNPQAQETFTDTISPGFGLKKTTLNLSGSSSPKTAI